MQQVIDMQMDISKECTNQSIKTCVVHKNFTSQMNVLFLSVSYHEKSDAEKVHSFMEEFPTVRRNTLHSAIGPRGYYKVWLSENNANDVEVKYFVLNNIPPPAHAPSHDGPPLPTVIPPHSFFIWDRLGRAGRCNNPSKQHYNPVIHKRIRESKIQVVMLPPKGHEANPTELFQAVMHARRCEKMAQAPGRRAQKYGPTTFREAQIAVSEVLGRLRFNIAAFRGWYGAPATGHHL